MRKLRPVLHIQVLLLGLLLGCGGSAQEPDHTPDVGASQPDATSASDIDSVDDSALGTGEPGAEILPGYSALRQPSTLDLEDMVERGYIRVLVVPSKTLYFLDGAQQRGATYEAMVEFERFLNAKIPGRDKVNIVFIPVRRDQLVSSIAEGTGDIAAASLTVTPERLELVDFSDAGVRNVKEVVITGPSAPQLTSIDDLSGQKVYVRRSSSYYDSLVRLNASFSEAGRTPVDIQIADENLEDGDLLEMVNADLLPAVIVDDFQAKLWEQVFDQITVHHDIAVREGGSIAWAVRKNSPQLLDVVNEFIKGHRAGTLFGNILLKRYLGTTKWVTNPGSREDMARFQATVDLFRQYSDTYDFDWLLIMAQSYQESRLDQQLRSRVGAIGVMQILPQTAAGPPINIPDISEIENNVHAGTKYLRHIIDQYLDDPEIDDLNKTLLAFAAYNGGPTRISRLRRKAAAQGLDPNRWFRNVEVIAAREIGQETVQYVSNIYKYYIAYKLIVQRQQERIAAGAKAEN